MIETKMYIGGKRETLACSWPCAAELCLEAEKRWFFYVWFETLDVLLCIDCMARV